MQCDDDDAGRGIVGYKVAAVVRFCEFCAHLDTTTARPTKIVKRSTSLSVIGFPNSPTHSKSVADIAMPIVASTTVSFLMALSFSPDVHQLRIDKVKRVYGE